MAWYLWSKTSANNATASPNINWAEGQSPSSINDSARAVMSDGACWRDDISGTITTGGNLNAYSVTSNQVFDTLAHLDGAMIAFVPHTTCGATVTLAVDGLAAKPLRSSPGVEIGAGVLVQGTPYVVTYNNSDGAFYLQGFVGNPFNIPLGGMMAYVGTTAPNANFVLPFGQAINRITYATLFALTGTTFGPGDGVNTFNLPDLRGRAIFGLGNMGGVDAGLITVAGGNFNGATLGATGGVQNHTLLTTEIPSHTHTATQSAHSHNYLRPDTPVSFGGAAVPAFTATTSTATDSVAPAIAVANAGGGAAHTILNPCMVLPLILRII